MRTEAGKRSAAAQAAVQPSRANYDPSQFAPRPGTKVVEVTAVPAARALASGIAAIAAVASNAVAGFDGWSWAAYVVMAVLFVLIATWTLPDVWGFGTGVWPQGVPVEPRARTLWLWTLGLLPANFILVVAPFLVSGGDVLAAIWGGMLIGNAVGYGWRFWRLRRYEREHGVVLYQQRRDRKAGLRGGSYARPIR